MPDDGWFLQGTVSRQHGVPDFDATIVVRGAGNEFIGWTTTDRNGAWSMTLPRRRVAWIDIIPSRFGGIAGYVPERRRAAGGGTVMRVTLRQIGIVGGIRATKFTQGAI